MAVLNVQDDDFLVQATEKLRQMSEAEQRISKGWQSVCKVCLEHSFWCKQTV